MQIWTSFLIAVSALLPIVNPVGSALELLPMLGDAPPSLYPRLARKIALNNVLFLLTIEILGSAILRFFGISISIMEISGGIVICGLGWATLNRPHAPVKPEQGYSPVKSTTEALEGRYIEQAFYPFTFPITSGPATVVTMLTLSAHASQPKPAATLQAHSGLVLAVLAVTVCVYGCYAYAPQLANKISPYTIHGIVRIISFIMFSIGIQITWNGLSAIIAAMR